MEINNKVVIITGGSQGFGKSLAGAFKKGGANVIISSHKKENLVETASELSIDSFVADVTSFDDIKELSEYVIKKYGKIDVWINNAGIQIAPSLVEEINIKKLHYLFDVNFFGYFYGCQVALIQMKKQNSGVIININSTAGLDGKPGISAYSSSKFAIKGLTESIRKEVKNLNIQVYGIFPGGMQTDIYKEKYPEDIKEYMKVDTVVEKVMDNLKSDNPEIDFIIKRPVK